ncbi:hypothetical protein RB195_021646 [Necator americanus]|uniref:Uncharacterized protein n=1 Tax=Necator americanus TaxID=51031 RepID=A0ABR1ECP9_NECAM
MDHGASIALLIACIVVLVESRYYDIENVADGHLRKHHAHDVKHHMKRAKPIETDYVGIDQHGQAYVNCTYNMDGVVGVRKCSMPASDAAFDMGLACFALWNGEGEIIAQDCWIHQELSLEQCQKKRCTHAKGYGSVNFCCCFGHECNGKLDL